MKNSIEELIDSYQRKIVSCNELIEIYKQTLETNAIHRIEIKKGCYNHIIQDLKNLLKDSEPKEEKDFLNYPHKQINMFDELE
jgi:hypothetical protein